MADLQEYEEVGPVRRDQMHVYDDIKTDNKMNKVNVLSPLWKQYLKMLVMAIVVSLFSAIVTYFTVCAQLQQNFDAELAQQKQKLDSLDTKLTEIDKKNEMNLQENEDQNNLTFSHLQKQIKELVAMTAHPSTSGTIVNTIMKFDDVKFSIGITNLSAYNTSGKFTCEHEGLYMISASVMTYTNDARYFIYLNGNHISETHIGHYGKYDHTGAVTVTRKLNQNDEVWLYAYGSWHFYGGWYSTLTIIKIK